MHRVLIVGCGGIAPAHIEGYLHSGADVTVTHLADQNLQRAQALIDRYGLTGAQPVADYREALSQVDIVSICTPPGQHAEIAVAALNLGCHVLLEKPMAPSLAECDAILAAAQANGRLLSVVAQSRYISGIRNVIEMVRGGAYGKNLYTRIHSVWYRGESYYDLGWRGRWTVEGGGCTQNHSIHHIDLLLWAKGMPASLRAFMTNLNHHNSEEEDFSTSVLRYPDGSVAELTSALIAHGEAQTLLFQMEKAGLEVPFKAYASKPRDNGFPEPDEAMVAAVTADFESRPKLPLENHDGQIANFLRAIDSTEPLLATGQDGRNSIELITGVYQSAITGQEVAFPIAAEGPYYTGAWRAQAPHFFEKTRDVAAFADTTITSFKNKF
ncbi:MAG: Gfo/Idh/MocA family oxidoreductase [Candidatus Limiplasma sp.]|nr:Gfo/Idh/MocA family oxidoreductase [Candidatus Limiplasma sp.]